MPDVGDEAGVSGKESRRRSGNPRGRTPGSDSVTQADIELLLANIKDESLRDLVTVTIETGCRPQESLRVEARHVDLANQRWVFPKSESKNKKLSRVVYLTRSRRGDCPAS